MADYIVSEEVLRQVLDALDDNMQDERVGQWVQMSRAVGAISEILASPPAEPEYDTPEWWAKVREHDKRKDT